ncbi:MAG: DegV family protein [Clostridia bacterium]
MHMIPYALFTDATADLPAAARAPYDITYLPMPLEIGGEAMVFDGCWDSERLRAFYGRLRAGESATTAQIAPYTYETAFEPVLCSGQDVLYLCFSSGLSATIQSAHLAKNTLEEKYPGRTVAIVDSLGATYGEGMAVLMAARNRESGLSLAENMAWLNGHIQSFAHWFTVEDLMYLKRGGRISLATALLGTTLKLKPVMHADASGHLIAVDRVQGRKNSLKALVKHFVESYTPEACGDVFIGHCDAEADALFLKGLLAAQLPDQPAQVGCICPIVGAHSGPGTIALFFFADKR